jgi:hypothetical protein
MRTPRLNVHLSRRSGIIATPLAALTALLLSSLHPGNDSRGDGPALQVAQATQEILVKPDATPLEPPIIANDHDDAAGSAGDGSGEHTPAALGEGHGVKVTTKSASSPDAEKRQLEHPGSQQHALEHGTSRQRELETHQVPGIKF